jgi:hypothetical protein
MKFKYRQDAYKNPFCDWPRNLSCFCGRGLKFKRCHEKAVKARMRVTKEEWKTLQYDFERLLNRVMNLSKIGHPFKLQKPIVE